MANNCNHIFNNYWLPAINKFIMSQVNSITAISFLVSSSQKGCSQTLCSSSSLSLPAAVGSSLHASNALVANAIKAWVKTVYFRRTGTLSGRICFQVGQKATYGRGCHHLVLTYSGRLPSIIGNSMLVRRYELDSLQGLHTQPRSLAPGGYASSSTSGINIALLSDKWFWEGTVERIRSNLSQTFQGQNRSVG